MPSMETLTDNIIINEEEEEAADNTRAHVEEEECNLTTTTTVFPDLIETTTTTTTIVAETTPLKDPTPDAHQLFEEMSEGEGEGEGEGEISEDEDNEDEEEEEDNEEETPQKKQKTLSSLTPQPPLPPTPSTTPTTASSKKSKKKNNGSVWAKSSSRKGKKKGKPCSTTPNATPTNPSDKVLITPVPRFPDKTDDSLDSTICLSKIYKAEKIELSEDRLSAGSSKGYRMVRATRGVGEGAWYFEIKVVKLGESGHTRLGWSMEKGDLQAPVGYDGNSFGYRDVDGSKVHKAMREKYGDGGYVEGDVIGFYINLPDGGLYAPKPPQYVWYKGQKYICAPEGAEELPKIVPGSEISFFKNGVCQGVAFKDLYGGRYYPAASMYTLPNQPNCVVNFNFGPDFEYFPQDFGYRPVPNPMIEVPYLSLDSGIENGISDDKKS